LKSIPKTYSNRADFAGVMLDQYFKNAPNRTVNDIGAGFGHMKAKIESLNAIWQPFDYFKKMKTTIGWDLNNEAPTNVSKAGVVIFLEVLKHLNNPFLALQNISNHIEKKGVLIMTVPNPQSSKNTLNLFLKGTLYAFQKKHLKENHVFTPWEHIVCYFLEQNGFEILEYASVDTAYRKRKPTSIKDWIKLKLENFIEYKNPKAIGMSYGLVAKKKQ